MEDRVPQHYLLTHLDCTRCIDPDHSTFVAWARATFELFPSLDPDPVPLACGCLLIFLPHHDEVAS